MSKSSLNRCEALPVCKRDLFMPRGAEGMLVTQRPRALMDVARRVPRVVSLNAVASPRATGDYWTRCVAWQLDVNLEMRERAQHRRQAQLYKEWTEKVYETIQAQIDRQLASLRTEGLSTRRRQLMEEYIRVSNQKRYGLYRDIIIESEYDPLLAHQKLLKYKISDANDPVKLEINNSQMGKPKQPLGKSGRRLKRTSGCAIPDAVPHAARFVCRASHAERHHVG